MNHDHERRALFDRWASTYDATVGAEAGFPFAGYARVLATIVERTSAAPGHRVLDIGTGSGNLAAAFAERGCIVTAIDFSPAMLDVARRKVPSAEFLCCDLARDDGWSVLAGRRFDRIVASYVLHELELASVALTARRLMKQLASPGATLVFGDIAFPTRAILDDARVRWRDRWDASEHYFAADETIAALATRGLRATYDQVSPCAGVFVVDRGP